MPTERSSMHLVREILRQKLTLGLSHRTVAKATGASIGKVATLSCQAASLHIDAARLDELNDEQLSALLYPKAAPSCERAEPDCVELHIELRKPGVTLALLHLEYLEAHPDGYRYTAFCDRYRQWSKHLSPVMRQTHIAGDKVFVDYAVAKPRLLDPLTGEVTQVELFVAVLGASNYTFAEATRTQRVPDFVASVARALAFFGGVPRAVVPDQLKSAVVSPSRYEPEIQRTTAELARHYGTTILPARPRSPRDKAKVEAGVLVAERWLLARIRKESFASLGALNARLAELLRDINTRTMKKFGATRLELFERLDKPALAALPDGAFVGATWKQVRLNIDYHIEFDHHLYSAPYLLVHQKLWVRATTSTIELLRDDNGERVATHTRSFVHGGRTTLTDHMPSAHRAHAEWTPSRILSWAATTVGPNTHALCEVILRERRHPEWGFRSCLGVLRLANKYEKERVERACLRALLGGARSYRSVLTILQHNLDRAPLPEAEAPAGTGTTHENIRGSGYYQ